MGLGG